MFSTTHNCLHSVLGNKICAGMRPNTKSPKIKYHTHSLSCFWTTNGRVRPARESCAMYKHQSEEEKWKTALAIT